MAEQVVQARIRSAVEQACRRYEGELAILRGHVAQLEESLAYERERSMRLLEELREYRDMAEQKRQEKFEDVLSVESVTQEQVDSLCRALTPAAVMVSGLMDVDVSRGRGVLPDEGGSTRHCLWTTRGHRVTVSVQNAGGLIVSRSKSPDPGAPDGTR
jgi:hypothetical protein